MKLNVHTYTNKGGRERNEDRLYTSVSGDNGIFIVADGLGGHKCGAVASELAVNTLPSLLEALNGPDSLGFREAVFDTNSEILKQQKNPEYSKMKTTLVALTVWGDKAVWGHVGDSRLYYFTDNELRSVTKDHSVSYKKYAAGDISYNAIRHDEDRSSLLGVLGNPEKCVPEITAQPVTLQNGDAFLLCTDGFWEYVWDEEMLLDLLKSQTAKEWADYMLMRHVRRSGTTNDNLSLITLFAGEGK